MWYSEVSQISGNVIRGQLNSHDKLNYVGEDYKDYNYNGHLGTDVNLYLMKQIQMNDVISIVLMELTECENFIKINLKIVISVHYRN